MSVLTNFDFNEVKTSERKLGKIVIDCVYKAYTRLLDYFLCSLVILFNVSLKLSTLMIRFSSNTSLCAKITRCTPSATPARIDLISPEFLISSNNAYSSIGTSIVTFLLPSLTITIPSLTSTLSSVILINSFFVFMLLYILVLIYSLSSYTLLLKRVTFIYSEGTNYHYMKILELKVGPVLGATRNFDKKKKHTLFFEGMSNDYVKTGQFLSSLIIKYIYYTNQILIRNNKFFFKYLFLIIKNRLFFKLVFLINCITVFRTTVLQLGQLYYSTVLQFFGLLAGGSKMSRLITMRIPHGEVWDKFRAAVNKKYGKQLGTIGLESENLMIRFLIEEGYEEYKESKYNGSNYQDTPENKSVSFFSEPKFSNKNYQALYEFLIQNDEDSIINFTVIKRFVNNTLGKLGRRTPHDYADAMADARSN